MLWLCLIRESDQTLFASNLHHSANFLHFCRATRGYSAWNYYWVQFGSSCGYSPMFFGCGAFRRLSCRPVIAVALLLLDIATPFCSFYRFPWAFFRAVVAFPATKIEGKPQ
jgi:hypothetical protein